MIGGRHVYAVFLMREGSKRVPDKCVRPLNGLPLALHTLYKLKDCEYMDKVYISTSSERYKLIARAWGFECIDRPESLSDDKTIMLDVVKDAVRKIPNLNPDDYILQTDPSSPMESGALFGQIIRQAYLNDLDSCFAVRELDVSLVDSEPVNSQDRKPVYCHVNFCRLRTVATTLVATGWGYGTRHQNLPVLSKWSVDIDTEDDWFVVQHLMRRMTK